MRYLVLAVVVILAACTDADVDFKGDTDELRSGGE